ncbi:beta-phosphoglucomutase [Salipaludibacillus sp. HK11]|uniref:beta-phosphoglucomutase n=1 Tax=Salipaludibacillus sp. HK11 TaxID=3394320 RepID=UPI0039FD791F
MKAIIFDLDGVLADTVEFHYLSTKQVAEKLNVPFTREMNQKFQGMNRKHLIKSLLNQSNETYTDEDVEQLGNLKNQWYKHYIQKITPANILPGMADLLMEINNEKIPMAIASSSSNARAVLEHLEIIHLFQIIVPSASVTHMKPNPEIFLKAADQLHVDYKDCVAIEDSEAGMQAIKSTSMFSVGVGNDPAVRTADWHVSSTKEISLKKLYKNFK